MALPSLYISAISGIVPLPAADQYGSSAYSAGSFVGPQYPLNPNWPQPNAIFAQQLLVITNAFRKTKGVGSLVFIPSLTASAGWKAAHMAQYLYMDHNDPAPPVARTWYDRFLDNGYAGGAGGENLAYAFLTAQDVFNAWTSGGPGEGHYDNIVQPTYTACGFGVAQASNGLIFWTQDFGVGSAPPPPPPPPPPPVTPEPAAGQIWENSRNVNIKVKLVSGGVVTYTNEKTGKTGHYTVDAFKLAFRYISG